MLGSDCGLLEGEPGGDFVGLGCLLGCLEEGIGLLVVFGLEGLAFDCLRGSISIGTVSSSLGARVTWPRFFGDRTMVSGCSFFSRCSTTASVIFGEGQYQLHCCRRFECSDFGVGLVFCVIKQLAQFHGRY